MMLSGPGRVKTCLLSWPLVKKIREGICISRAYEMSPKWYKKPFVCLEAINEGRNPLECL